MYSDHHFYLHDNDDLCVGECHEGVLLAMSIQ